MSLQTATGPVERELLEELENTVRQRNLVFWLDKYGHYTELVDRMVHARKTGEAGELAYPVVAVRGSYLAAMLALEQFGSAEQPERLLIHLPGHDEASVRTTPLLELYELGFRYRRALDTLVEQVATGLLAPAEVRALVGRRDLTLALAESTLAEHLGERREGLDKTLSRLALEQVAESVLAGTGLVTSVVAPADFTALNEYLHRQTGYETQWAERAVGKLDAGSDAPQRRDHLRKSFGAWLLLLEFVHDLQRAPKMPTLVELTRVPSELVKRSHLLVIHLRARHPEQYVSLATELEALVEEEKKDITAAELGRIDTFAFEERTVLKGAIEALREGQWAEVLKWAKDRTGEASFWLERERFRRWAWMLAEQVAELGVAVDASPRPLEGQRTLDAAVERYAAEAFRVDRAHRLFEQRWHELRDPQLPHWDEILEIVNVVRKHYRVWADQLARDFTAICVREGFLPDAALQQRTLFDQVVVPLTKEGDTVAVFMIDALRYEMAEALAAEMRQATGVTVDLRARLAELPTLTAVGMNALAPVAREGRLDAVMSAGGSVRGFRSGTFAVTDPTTRARAMGERAIGDAARLVKLEEVVDAPAKRLQGWVTKGPKLIVVHSLELDDAGEAGFGLATFEHTLRQVRAAWHHLSVAGVKTFVFTADHGFLLQDATTTVRAYGKKTDPSRRHVWHESEVREEGIVPVSLSKLGYDGAPGYLLLREDTAVYATSGGGGAFVHGGNSLEERVIPVLVVKRKRGPGQSGSAYAIEAQILRPLMGTQRVRLRVQLANDVTGSLAFAAAQSIRISLTAKDRSDVNVRLRDCDGPAKLRGGALEVQVGAEWTSVLFVLEGTADDRVRLEVNHPDRTETVESVVLQEYFTVTGTGVVSPASRSDRPPPIVPNAPSNTSTPMLPWQDAIEDEKFRAVFEFIDKHGSINEEALVKLAGPRGARTFAREFERMIDKLPFRVRIETAGAQKVYMKDGGR